MTNLPMQKAYYPARATDTPIKFGTASTGTQQISVEFILLDDAYPDERHTWIGNFTDGTSERSVESLQIAGWQGDELAELENQPGSQMLPNEVSLCIEPEADQQGVVRLKVQWVNRPGGGKFKFKQELTGNDLKAFSAQMKNTVRSVRASGGAPRKASGGSSAQRPSGGGQQRIADRHPNAPGADDDIPF
jgi:hypothetical protein